MKTLKKHQPNFSGFLHHLLSRMVGRLASCHWFWVKNSFISIFLRCYAVNMEEAEQTDPYAYPSFNAFFIRRLKTGVRPIDPAPKAMVSPVDGLISESGVVQKGSLIHAKSAHLSLVHLLGGEENEASLFHNGHFITLYLAPKDYHRVHMPYTGELRKMVYVPGDLFSVNPITVAKIPGVLARNERLIMHFKTDTGPLCVIMVGAMIVASLATPWEGMITPPRSLQLRTWDYVNTPVILKKGDEIGHFKLGSTVILLTPHKTPPWQRSTEPGRTIKMGEKL